MGTFIKSNADTHMMTLLYGPPGSGKSYSLTTYTKGPILLVQTEPGFISALKDPTFKAGVDAGTHTIFGATEWSDVDQWRFPGGFEKWLAKNGLKMPSLLFLDSATWLQEFAKFEVMRVYPSKAETRRPEDRIPEKSHYGMISELMKQIMIGLYRIPCDKIITAQAEIRELEEPGTTINQFWMPSLIGKYATKVGHDVDMVLYTRRNGAGQFIAEPRQTTTHLGKSRGLELPKEIPLNLDQIHDMWAKVRV